RAVAAHDGIDIVVSCVGIFDFYRRLEDLEPGVLDDAFDEIFAVNVKSYLHTVRAAFPELRRRRGCVVLTESTSSYYPGRGGVLYVTSKFAVRGLVTALAAELAPEIRVNAVAPGGTLDTDLRGPHALGQEQRILGNTPGRREELIGRTPLEVALTGADHAWSYVFLGSSRARGITGGVLHPDGGMSVKT
ncbi:MAG TPA: SDR family oxidoreductase, partial [Lapillicoccus sp.]|nr:SDR family oxidoreductase [Lapillicoccus sp.]